MKRYSLIVALHIIGIAFLSVGVYLLVDAGLWFSTRISFCHASISLRSSTRVRKFLIASEEYIRIELPETDRILQIDRTQIEQVLINLIKNAKEACSRKEHPRIEVKMLPALSWQCLITVNDNGEGILPEGLVVKKIGRAHV